MNDLHPCLLFADAADEAAQFYLSVFPGARLLDTMRYGEAGPGPVGAILAQTIEVAGQRLLLLNGPNLSFTPAISLFVTCTDQAEVDLLWDRLLEGGTPIQCGWITDRFGVTWQIVPAGLLALIQDADRERAGRAMRAMMSMVKLDIHAIRAAADEA